MNKPTNKELAKQLRDWAAEQDKSEKAASEQWAALSHAETATFFRQCAEALEAK